MYGNHFFVFKLITLRTVLPWSGKFRSATISIRKWNKPSCLPAQWLLSSPYTWPYSLQHDCSYANSKAALESTFISNKQHEACTGNRVIGFAAKCCTGTLLDSLPVIKAITFFIHIVELIFFLWMVTDLRPQLVMGIRKSYK